MSKEKVKVYTYTRVSTAMQIDGYSLDAQMSRMKAFADFNDYEIIREYQDAGKSGRSIEGRAQFRQMMDEKGWDYGEDDEELFELAMHERQYLDYRSGIAKERFNKELEEFRAKAGAPIVVTRPVVDMPKFDADEYARKYPNAVPVQAPVKGQLLWQVDVDDDSAAPVAGTAVKAGEGMGFVQTYYGMEEIVPAVDGRVVAVLGKQGEKVVKGEIVAFVEGPQA